MSTSWTPAKPPLFTACDQDCAGTTADQLDAQSVSFPISYTLLTLLNRYGAPDASAQQINALVDEIIKSPSHFFPDVPLLFERQGVGIFVPDDLQCHKLNWAALIVQYHISLLLTLGWAAVSAGARPPSRRESVDELDSRARPAATPSESRRREESRRDYATGSIVMRQERGCINSFSARAVGSVHNAPSFGSLRFSFAPGAPEPSAPAEVAPVSLEIESIAEFQTSCSLDSPTFRAIFLAVAARGTLDRACGQVLQRELAEVLRAAGVTVAADSSDASAAFDDFYNGVLRCLLEPDAEQQFLAELSHDSVRPILERIAALEPFVIVPHSYDFLESVLAPLSYHENSLYAAQAEIGRAHV
jgi:hypothetical protein